MTAGWQVQRRRAPAAELHAVGVPESPSRSVTFLDVDAPAVVLGSVQRVPADVAARPEVVRRQSGGGAVWLAPGAQVWVDVVVPRHDARWTEDVGRAFWWLGDVWAAALSSPDIGLGDLVVHRGALRCTAWSSQVCFAGVGPGEVTLGADGPKVVGMAQRRSRAGALFQCSVPLDWNPVPLVEALGLGSAAAPELAGVASAVDAPASAVESAFLAALAAAG